MLGQACDPTGWNGTPGPPPHAHACARTGSGSRPQINDDCDKEAILAATVTAPSAVVPLDQLGPVRADLFNDLFSGRFVAQL